MITDAIAYTPVGAASASGTTRSGIFDAIRAGELKARKKGRRTIIRAEDLKAWVDSFPAREVAKAA
jgi:hypothetical protein